MIKTRNFLLKIISLVIGIAIFTVGIVLKIDITLLVLMSFISGILIMEKNMTSLEKEGLLLKLKEIKPVLKKEQPKFIRQEKISDIENLKNEIEAKINMEKHFEKISEKYIIFINEALSCERDIMQIKEIINKSEESEKSKSRLNEVTYYLLKRIGYILNSSKNVLDNKNIDFVNKKYEENIIEIKRIKESTLKGSESIKKAALQKNIILYEMEEMRIEFLELLNIR